VGDGENERQREECMYVQEGMKTLVHAGCLSRNYSEMCQRRPSRRMWGEMVSGETLGGGLQILDKCVSVLWLLCHQLNLIDLKKSLLAPHLGGILHRLTVIWYKSQYTYIMYQKKNWWLSDLGMNMKKTLMSHLEWVYSQC